MVSDNQWGWEVWDQVWSLMVLDLSDVWLGSVRPLVMWWCRTTSGAGWCGTRYGAG